MPEEEPKIKFIANIAQEFEHIVGNALAHVSTSFGLIKLRGREFVKEDVEFQKLVKGSKSDLLRGLDEILSSEFNTVGELNKESITSFRQTVEGSDFENEEEVKNIVNEFERLKATVPENQ